MVNFYLPDKLQKRQKLSDKLSTFWDFTGTARAIHPICKRDNQLWFNIGYLQKSDTHFSVLFTTEKEIETVLYLLDRVSIEAQTDKIQSHNNRHLNQKHILSYFEEACYQAVRVRCKAWIDFENPRDTFDIYWQIGRGILSNLDRLHKILKKYDPTCSKKIEVYVREVLICDIRDEYYQKTGQGKRTIWGALKVESKTRLRKALKLYGVAEPIISVCLLAWKCFFQVYQPSGEGKRRKFLDPSQQDFDRAVELYQMKQEQSSHKEKIRVPNMTTEKLQNSLENCIAAMQHYDKLEKQRIDPIYLEELSPREHESSLFEASKSGLDTLASQELEMEQKTQDYQSEVDRFLKEELGRLRQQIEETPQIPSLYVIVVLCYGLGLKQSEAETLLLINGIEIDRSSISRHLTQLKTIWVERLWDCFRDEIEPIATDEHFDRNLARWSKQRQQNVEEGLRAYLREEITDTLGQFVLPYFANRHHFENARTFWKYYLHLWSLQTLGVTLMWDTLPPDIDPKKVNKLTKRIDLFVQHSLIELAN